MFDRFAKLAGYAEQFKLDAEEARVLVLLSGRTDPLVRLFSLMGVVCPKNKAGMLAFLAGDALAQSPIRGDASQAWPLFCKASAACLQGDRTLCDSFEQDAQRAIDTVRDARKAKKASKAPVTPTTATSPAVVAFVAHAADPVSDALAVLSVAVNAGTLTPEQCDALRAMVDMLAVPL